MTVTLPALRWPRRSWRPSRRALFGVATFVVAAVPGWVALVDAVRSHWTPEGDDAVVVMKVMDVFAGHLPLMGMRSTSGVLDQTLASHHLGPLEFYLLAPVSRLGAYTPTAVALATVLLNMAFIAAALYWADRLGGRLLVVLVGGAALAVQWAVGTETLFRPLNTNPAPLAVLAMLVAATAVLRGYRSRRWTLILLVSFVAQANLAYLPLVLGVSAVLVTASVFRHRGQGFRRPRGETGVSIRSAVIVGAVVWLPTVIENVRFSPSNLSQVFRYATERSGEQLGLESSVHLLSALAPVPGGFGQVDPWFLFNRGTLAACLGILVAVLLVVVMLRPPRDGVVRPGAMVALSATGSMCAGFVGLPADGLPASYWVTPILAVAVWSWCVLIVAAVEHLKGIRASAVKVAWPTLGVLVVMSFAVALTFRTISPGTTAVAHQMNDIAGRLVAGGEVEPGSSVRIETAGVSSWWSYGPSLAYALRQRGVVPYTGGGWPFAEDVDWRRAEAAPPGTRTIVVADDSTTSVPVRATLVATAVAGDKDHPGASVFILPGAS